jgi:hypothetical protein
MCRRASDRRASRTGIHRALARGAIALAAFMTACGGRLVPDASGGRPGSRDGATTDDGIAQDGVANGSAPNGLFPSACASYALVAGQASCAGCIMRAMQANCGALQTRLQDQCSSVYLCGVSHCPFNDPPTPSGTASLCSCVAGCLPTADSPCTQLWSAVMQCVGSYCAGGC